MRAAARPTLLLPEELADPGIRIAQLTQAAESRAVSGGSKGKVQSWMEETSLCQDQPLLHPQVPKIHTSH